MSYLNPGIDTGHIIKDAFNSRSLKKVVQDTPETLRDSLVESGTLPKNATAADAIKWQQLQIHSPRERIPFLIKETIYDQIDLEYVRDACRKATQDQLFEYLGIKRDGDTIDHYGWPQKRFSFKAVGIDEEKLLDGIKTIAGDCDLRGSELKSLGNVENVGNLYLPYFTKVEDLSGLKDVKSATWRNVFDKEETEDMFRGLNLNTDTKFLPDDSMYKESCSSYLSAFNR